MNIFVLDNNPVQAAIQQCDKHVVKMIVESAQMLSTAHRILDGIPHEEKTSNGRKIVRYRLSLFDDVYYQSVHPKHPSTLWTMESSSNYEWHWEHFVALCEEYTHRYGKVHSTDKKLRTILKVPPTNIPIGPLTPFRLAMGSNPECVDPENPVQSYRNFYMTKQKRFKMVWSSRPVPEWFKKTA